MQYEKEILEKLHSIEIEIMDVIAEFCKENNIQYSLAFGALIGAARHKGFIPWDDDVDLMMERSEYDRFISLWNISHPAGYVLVNDEIYEDYPNNFLKIQKEHTAFIQFESEKQAGYPHGIFVDIFPLDRVAPGLIQRKFQYFSCAINMLMTRGYTSPNPGLIERFFFSLSPRIKKWLKKKTYGYKTKWNKNRLLQMFWNGTMVGCKTYYPSDLCDGFIESEFEGRNYKVFAEYDCCLRKFYGDYMQLPPEEKRINHMPIVLDFNHSFEAH